MFQILKKTFDSGLVTIGYPDAPARISDHFRGAPRFDFANWRDAREVTVDYGLCIFCGECSAADTSGAVRMSRDFELAVRDRRNLVTIAEYEVMAGGTQQLKQVRDQ